MIFLWILAALLLVLCAFLFLPVCVAVDFKDDFIFKIYFLKIKLYDSKREKSKPEQKKSNDKTQTETTKTKSKNLFLRFKEKFGFTRAVKEFFGFFKDAFSHIKGFLRHIKFEKVKFFINVASTDAAKTAIEYGVVCGVVYPVLTMLDSAGNIKYKKIDIKSDFGSENSDFNFSFLVKLRVFYLLVTLFKVYKDYKNFIARIETDERK